MRNSARVLLLVFALVLTGLLGAAPPASAVCDPLLYSVTGRCTNGCVEAARAFAKVTGKPAPWDCLQ